jgi:hypothetical protein
MGNFDGQVLPGARASTSNADTTGEVSSGVSRAVFTSTTPTYPTVTVTDINGARYRATLLESGQTVEYLLWANTSGPLTVAPGTTSTDGTVAIPTGVLPVGAYLDGTKRAVLTDNGGANIVAVSALTFTQGGTTAPIPVPGGFTFDPTSGTINLTTLVVSASRGDTLQATYIVGPATFNWTRNDPTGTRFGWNAAHRKWEPFKGGAVKNLGKLLSSAGSRYTLSPIPTTPVGSYLPGTSTVGDYAMLRLGASPDEASYPVVTTGSYSGVLVVADDVATPSYNFSSVSPALAGVVGNNSGKIAWNPAFVADHEGETLWYSPRDFAAKNDGVVGPLVGGPHYIAPVPGPTDRPILRIGQRAPLTVITVANETFLGTLTVNPGEVGVALSTGRVKLNAADVAKAIPSSPSFDPLYLDASLRYDGIALNRYPQPVQAPALLTSSGDDYTIPAAVGLPGTGVSGILRVPDGTGNAPDPALPVEPRPLSSGLVEGLTPGFGDAYLFTNEERIAKLVPVNYDTDLPTDLFSLPLDTAYVSLDTGRVRVGYALRQLLGAKSVYFVQAVVTPAQYPDTARVFSRVRDTFTFAGTETFTFSVDGVTFNYSPAAGTNVPVVTVATALNALMGAGGTAGVLSGYLFIASPLATGAVAVGFDEDGCRVMGFPPGWRVSNPGAGTKDATDGNWLPDTGLAFGLSRSPNNLDGSQPAADVRATYRVTDAVLSEDLSPVPYQLLNYPPREDIAGYDTGEFFALSGVASPNTVRLSTTVKPWKDAVYQFDQSRFAWLSTFSFAGQVQSPVASINLGNAGVVPSTFYPPNPSRQWTGGSLKVSATGGAAQTLTFGTDFLVPPGTGEALLITRIGELKQSGYRGSIAGSTLTDTSVTITAAAGDRLKVTSGANAGSYTVTASTATTVTVTPSFVAASTGNVAWELYDGVPPGTINPAVLGDAVYRDFNHLPSEPYEVRLLTLLGTAPAAPSAIDLPTATSGRTLAVRYGQTGADFPATILTSAELGAIANGVLNVPTAGARFATGSFSVVVGTKVFAHGVDLIPVPNFAAPIPANVVQYRTTDGELRFGATVLADYQSATVVYREEVLPSANIPAGTSEISPFTGAVSVAGLTSQTERIYLVDLQTFETVFLNPILGAFSFARPVQTGQLVQVTYYRAVPDSGALYLDGDGNPVQVTEFLPVFIRREQATRVTAQLYSFNAAGRTIDTDVEPSVYVGATMVSYGIPTGVTVTPSNNTLSLVKAVNDPATKVLITYGVFEAVGGETSYTVSQGPVWRPPFRLEANVPTFKLDGDRTSDMVPGRILRIGNYLTYVKAASYSGLPADVTTVTVYPTPTKSVGTLSPSEPPINLLTDRAITPTVDPAGTSPVATAADAGFLPLLTTAYGLPSVPAFQPVTKGQNVVRFDGDLTRYAVAGHVIELFGIPFLIAKGDFVDGSFTDITLGSPSPVQMVWTAGMNPNLARISVRPIYSEGALVFLGAGAFVGTEPYEVVLYEGTAPGRTLAEGQDYQLDPSAGTLSLLEPRTQGLPALSSLQFYRTAQNTLAPFVFQGKVQYPRVSANAGYIDPPGESNGRLGATLTATYTFDSPDSFYARSLPLPAYVTETARSIVQGVTRNAAGTSPSVGGFPKNSPSTQGTAGLVSERQDLVSRDRVTRTFLRYYNGVITSFEQVLETINGNPVGDRDGKLRLWMGAGDPWTPPGYEDGITGAINPRNVWNEVWNGFRTSPIALLPSDPIVSPYGATLTGGVLTGTTLSASALGQLQGLQYRAIKNDVDDVVLNGLTGTTVALAGIIRFKVTSYGVYRGLSQPSAFSRLYPERAEAFTTTDPGIGYDPATGATGVYSYGKLDLDLFGSPPSVSFQSTTGNPIARLANPVRGNITSVLGATVQDRLARARIIAYYPNGVAGVTTSPVFLATVLPLDKFPLLPNGQPDTAKLVAGAGISGLYDLTSGDPDLHIPPFNPGDQLALGTPDGTTYSVGYTGATVTVNGNPVFPGVFVDTIFQGCYLTVKSYSAANNFVPVLNPATLLRLTSGNTGTTLTAERGDTLFVVPTTGAFTAIASPPVSALTPTQLQTFTASLPGYRVGTDVDLDGRAGALVDATLPSFSDPTIFGLKEITGQRPPSPLRNLQARVTFQNGDVSPSNIPALRGASRLDSGDYSLPYYQIAPTELAVLGDAFTAGVEFYSLDTVTPPANPPAPGYPAYAVEAAYPDEILDNAGAVNSLPTAPAALRASATLDPPFAAHSGVGSVNPYDLVFVQQGTGGLPNGSQGILTVGAVDYGAKVIEPPRFISRTDKNSLIDLNVTAIQTFIEADPPFPAPHTTGIKVVQDTTGPTCITTFELVGIPNLVFDDNNGGGGVVPPTGGFNTFFTLSDKPSEIRLNVMKASGVFSPATTFILQLNVPNPAITGCVFNISGDNGGSFVLNVGPCFFNTTKLTVETAAPVFNFLPYGGGTSPAPGILELDPLDFTIDLVAVKSAAYLVEGDRLTVSGPVDTRSARERGAVNPAAESVECRLEVVRALSTYETTVPVGTADIYNTVNNAANVNGGVPFTFLPRSYAPFTTGTFGVGAETGTGVFALKTMPFEGHGNTPISSTGITFSAAPSARQNTTNAILTANVYTDRVDGTPVAHTFSWGDNRFIPSATLTGATASVLPGDIVTLRSNSEDPAYTKAAQNGKAGTHLVRGVITSSGPLERRDVTYTVPDGAGDYSSGWLPVAFPTVVTATATDLIVSEIPSLPPSKNWAGTATAQTHTFPPAGRVFVIVNEAGLNSPVPATFASSIVSADYTGFNPTLGKFSGLNNYQDGQGLAISGAAFATAAQAGLKVSGFTMIPLNPRGDGIPENLPGYCNGGDGASPNSAYGLRTLQATRGANTLNWTAAPSGFLLAVAPAAAKVDVYEKIKLTSETFLPLSAPVYDEIPGVMDITSIYTAGTDWDRLHTPTGVYPPPFSISGARCLLPGDAWAVDYSGAAGIYVEPSFPRTGNTLADPIYRNVVDAGNTSTTSRVGVRRLTTYMTSVPVAGNSYLEVGQIEVRRPRRFHDLGNSFAEALLSLRYSYEIRRGIVSTVTASGGYGVLTADAVNGAVPPVATVGGTATQLGDFTSKLVNVNPGDEVRFLNASGVITARAEVVKVTGARTLTLSRKVTVTPGARFEVYLKVPPVPHEQSNEELLGYATDRVLINSPADLVAQTGGRAPATNKIVDTDTTVNYTAAGVAEGDIVVIDPAGTLTTPAGSTTPPQYGRRPYGDNAVLGRANYAAGSPARADDNRGYYRVVSRTATQLTVEAIGGLAGNNGGDVTFGSGTNAYAVYPTVHASGLTGGTEGQMDLRETAPPVGNSYTTTFKSIEPFAYRVIRPTSLLSPETVELILSMRERMLSWMEEIRAVRFKYGTYFVFQRDRHITDLGLTTDPESGLGLLTNPYLFGIVGNWAVAPFANVRDCLSILDRRFWCLDFRLDTLTPPYGISVTPYANFTAGVGRPVLVDRVNEALDARDKLRATRYAWLDLRVNRVTGSLENIRRFDVERPRREAEAERALLTVQSVEKLP